MSEKDNVALQRKPECDMPDCEARPEDSSHAVKDPDGNLMKMCDSCLNDGWRAVVEVLDDE